MLKHEFEELAKIEVSYDDYKNIIEPMYMATNLSKQDFINTLNLKRFALKSKKQLINELKKLAKNIEEACCNYTNDYEAEAKIESIIEELKERFNDNCYITADIKNGCFYYDFIFIGNEKIYLL